MIGLGVLSFIAANWKILPDAVKIALIAGSYAASVAGAYLCEKRNWGAVSDVFLFLSGFLILGGLALISQIFHVQGSLTDLLGIWLLVYLPTFLLARGIAIYTLYGAVGFGYMDIFYTQHYFWLSSGRDLSSIFTFYQPLLLLVLIVAVAWYSWFSERRSVRAPRSALSAVFVGGSTRKIFLSNFLILNWFRWVCVIDLAKDDVLPCVIGILIIGVLISLSAWKLDAADLDLQGLWCVGLAGFALTLHIIWDWNDSVSMSETLSRQILSSAALGVWLLWRVVRRRRYAAFSAFLFCGLLARWYFDMFYNFMSKSLFFTLGGAMLLLAAFACHRWNKKGNGNKEENKEEKRAGAADSEGGDVSADVS
jgi:uncharacterized membrane protein